MQGTVFCPPGFGLMAAFDSSGFLFPGFQDSFLAGFSISSEMALYPLPDAIPQGSALFYLKKKKKSIVYWPLFMVDQWGMSWHYSA